MATTSSTKDEGSSAFITEDDSKLNTYTCTSCSYPVEIYEINDSINTIKFKCLNPIQEERIKTIPIGEYLEAMKKNTYLYSECSLCKKKQNELKDSQFLYCIKCNLVICPDCKNEHLESNKENHPDSSTENIIKNNEKSILCLIHPKEKNIGFCFDCNTHICKECMKSRKHRKHRKNSLLEVEVTDKMKNILKNLRDVYKNKIKIENKKKELNNDLYKLRIKYEKDVKLKKDEYKIFEDKINKKTENSTDKDNELFNQELEKIKNEYNEANLECDKKIKWYQNLITINQILKNTQEKFSDNYYYNNNINNIIYNYYKCRDENIKKILDDDVYNELKTKADKEEEYYKQYYKQILKPTIIPINPAPTKKPIIHQNGISIIYTIDKKKEGINIFGKNFVKNNKRKCRIVINEKSYEICNYIIYSDFGINKNNDSFKIFLKGINNITDASDMFRECNSLKSIPDIDNWDTKNVTNISGMFRLCNSKQSLPDISKLNTKNVTDMSYFCDGCISLTSLPDISQWDTQNVETMGSMFNRCSCLKSLPDIEKWNILKVKNKQYMFHDCPASLNIPPKFLNQ